VLLGETQPPVSAEERVNETGSPSSTVTKPTKGDGYADNFDVSPSVALPDGVAAVDNRPDLDAQPAGESATLAATGTDDPVVVGAAVNNREQAHTDVNSPKVLSEADAGVCAENTGKQVDSQSFAIGATGFEPAASWTQTRRSSQAELRPGGVTMLRNPWVFENSRT
jgi:hypothetical protein